MSTEDLENYEAERELQLAQEYQDVSGMFRYAVETERRFYLANEVSVNGRSTTAPGRPAWRWSSATPGCGTCTARAASCRACGSCTFKDVNVEELPGQEI